jgi:hypothetical protein
VSRDDFLAAVSSIKGQCSSAAELLIEELSRRFPDSEIMEALGIVFPQYWRSPDCDTLFPMHMQVIKKWYCDMREISFGEGSEKVTTQVAQLLDSYKLDLQSSLFKLTMKSNAEKMLIKTLSRSYGRNLDVTACSFQSSVSSCGWQRLPLLPCWVVWKMRELFHLSSS